MQQKAQGIKPCAFSLPCRDKARNTVYKNVYRVQSLSVLVRQVIKYPNQLQVQVGVGYIKLRVKIN